MKTPSRYQAFTLEMDQARQCYRTGDLARAFYHLENAHVLGQNRAGRHALSHWWMLKVGWRRRDGREVFGQLMRILAALIVSRLWVPPGNTGGADVSPLRPMPVREELRPYFER